MLRGEASSCPVCAERALDTDGERLTCGGCTGVFVTEAFVRRAIAEAERHGVQVAPIEHELALHPATVVEPARRCPRCMSDMAKHDLHGVIVDRCSAHGLWFDGEELQRVLAKLGLAPYKWRTLKESITVGVLTAGYIAAAVLGILAGV